MIYGSVCSGIEAATVAWRPLRWRAAWFAEIDKFASAVLAHRYPEVRNFGDFTQIDAAAAGAIDVLVGGTPCQSFSLAGHRLGLDDPRGNLTMEFLRLAARARPRWVVWENVPGVLSIDGGRTFGTVLRTLADLGYGVAYRVLDAQFFGVPQRRRRVFVVAHLGGWQAPAAVLFERESLRRDLAPRRAPGEEIAGTLEARATTGGFDPGAHGAATGYLIPAEIVGHSVSAKWAKRGSGPSGSEYHNLVAHTLRGEGFDATEDGSGKGIPLAVAFSCKDYGADASEDVAPTLRAMGHNESHPNAGGQLAVAFRGCGQDGFVPREIAPPITSTDGGNTVPMVFEARYARNGRGAPDIVAPPLKAQSGTSGRGDGAPLLMTSYGSTEEGNTAALLRELRLEAGEKAFAEWRSRILNSLQQEEVLRQGMLRGTPGEGEAAYGKPELDDGALPCPQSVSSGSLRAVWTAGQDRRSPHRRGLAEQLARESGAALPELSPEGTSALCGLNASYVAVRRLTPRECERLMGFPDDWTLIPGYSIKLRPDEIVEMAEYLRIPIEEARRLGATPDGPRYKALGNSMAVCVMRWIGARIDHVDRVLREAA